MVLSKRNPVVNGANWNILVASGKKIKRDSMISVNESRSVYIISKMVKKLFELNGVPSPKTKYNTWP